MSYILNFRVGNDIGNSEHDIVINGKFIAQPNVFAKVRELPMLEELSPSKVISDINNNLIVSITSESVPSGMYYVGEYALQSGKRIHNMEVGLLNDKTNSDVVVINTLGQIAGEAASLAYTDDATFSENIEAHVDMTVALPVTQYNRSNADILRKRFFEKKHVVIVHVGELRAEVNIVFKYVKVLPESIPAVFYLQKTSGDIFNDFKSLYKIDVNGDFFKNKRILHVGIGEGTTEYPLTDDIEFNPDFIEGSDNGIGHAIEKAIRPFSNSVGLRTFTRQNYSTLLRDPLHKYYAKAMDFIEDPLEEESEAILHNVKAEVEKANNEVDIIFVHGGGSILMRPHLYDKLEKLCKKADIKLFYVLPEYAVPLEAFGMYEFTSSEIFDRLKLKSTGENSLQIEDCKAEVTA